MLKAQAGIDAVHVPYRGLAGMQQAIMAGEVQFMFDSIGSCKQFSEAGKFRALAVTGKERSKEVPQLPTLAESGFAGFDARIWLGLFAPAKTPPAIIDKLQAQIVRLVASPELRNHIINNVSDPVGSTGDVLAARMREETPRWKDIIDKTNLKANK